MSFKQRNSHNNPSHQARRGRKGNKKNEYPERNPCEGERERGKERERERESQREETQRESQRKASDMLLTEKLVGKFKSHEKSFVIRKTYSSRSG